MQDREAVYTHSLYTLPVHPVCTSLSPAGVSVVEDIDKRREPLPLAAVYFISPCSSSVAQLVADFETKPLYPSVHVFFSSGVTQEAVDRIKRCRVRDWAGVTACLQQCNVLVSHRRMAVPVCRCDLPQCVCMCLLCCVWAAH
jgi:hypothetical protein